MMNPSATSTQCLAIICSDHSRYEKGSSFRLFAHWSHHTQIGVSSVCLFGGKTPEYPLRINETEAQHLSHKKPGILRMFSQQKKIRQIFWELSEKKKKPGAADCIKNANSTTTSAAFELEGAARPREKTHSNPSREWRSVGKRSPGVGGESRCS